MPATSLLCFPFAGAGAAAFRRWQENSTDALRIVPVQLPGREERFGEPPYADVGRAVEGLLPSLLEVIGEDRRVALFGHSLGAVLAYEAAHWLTRMEGLTVVRLFVSGSPGPWTRRRTRATGLSDEEFLDQVRQFAGYTHPALEHPELRAMLLPVLRADVEMHENYRPPPDQRLGTAITSMRGVDDELVSAAQAGEWEAATTGGCEVVELPGGHMYLVDSPVAVVRLITTTVADQVGRGVIGC